MMIGFPRQRRPTRESIDLDRALAEVKQRRERVETPAVHRQRTARSRIAAPTVHEISHVAVTASDALAPRQL